MKLNEFINIFKENSKNLNTDYKLDNYLDILDNLKGNCWEKYKCKNIEGKKYHKEKIFSNNYCDIFIITWFSESVIHDHAENGCIFKLLEGKLNESFYKKENGKLIHIKDTIYEKNSTGYIDNNIGYHKITNLLTNPSYSINIYSPSKYKCKEMI